MVSRFSISTALVQSKSSSGKKKSPPHFPENLVIFIYLNNQATLPCHFNFHIFSLCVFVLWFSEISSLQPTAINYCPEQSSLSNSISNKMKKKKWESGPQPILWAPFSQGLRSYFASSSKPKLRAGAIASFVAKWETLNRNKTSFQAHQSVNANCFFG